MVAKSTHFLLLIAAHVVLAGDTAVINEGFEAEVPIFHTYRSTYAADTSRAHTGKRSLQVTPTQSGVGGAYFKLDGKIDLKRDYEFSAWVYAGADGAISFYVSALGDKQRYTKAGAVGGKAGQWVQIKGSVRGREWRKSDRDIMLAMITRGPSWFDDVVLRPVTLPDPAIETWPKLEAMLHAEADKHAARLSRGSRLVLEPSHGALAADIGRLEVSTAPTAAVDVPADGVLTFAVDVAEPTYVTGKVSLAPDKDLRPGLRAYVLSNSTLVAAPMVAAPAWQSVGNPMTGPAPDCQGAAPPVEVKLVQWLLTPGRHYLTIAGPHFRAAGRFQRMVIETVERIPQTPSYQFALLSDTHVGKGRSVWMNRKMCGPVAAELTNTLQSLRAQGVAFAVIAGDMADGATADQFAALAEAIEKSGLQVYGCVGNHDAYHSSSRPDVLRIAPKLFVGGTTDYVLHRPPLRFVVTDGSYWRTRDGKFVDFYKPGQAAGIGMRPEQIEWLRQTLAADTSTPTVVVSHYPFYHRGGLTSCGYKLRASMGQREVMALVDAAPNVLAALNGHAHWQGADVRKNTACIQNAAFVEWPNSYRVLRVYPDRMEWETRLARNFGFVRESFVPAKTLSWAISTSEGDVAGTVAWKPENH